MSAMLDEIKRNPSLESVMHALKTRSLDHRGISQATGMGLPAVKTYVTRLVFLGAIAPVGGGKYGLTREAIIGASVSAIQELRASLARK